MVLLIYIIFIIIPLSLLISMFVYILKKKPAPRFIRKAAIFLLFLAILPLFFGLTLTGWSSLLGLYFAPPILVTILISVPILLTYILIHIIKRKPIPNLLRSNLLPILILLLVLFISLNCLSLYFWFPFAQTSSLFIAGKRRNQRQDPFPTSLFPPQF